MYVTILAVDNQKQQSINIAILTAGALRSFAYTAKSWENYLLTQQNSYTDLLNVKLFAHVLHDNLRCPIARIGLTHLQQFATVLEIGDVATAPGDQPESITETLAKIPQRFVRYFPYLRRDGNYKHARGNVIDMHRRRARAFSLALQYGKINEIFWDAVLFVRPDTAFYSPRLDLYQMASNLILSRKNESHSDHVVYSPTACNFHWGVCDRFMFLLFDDATKIFVNDYVFMALKWIDQADAVQAKFLRGLKNMNSFSEQLMSAVFAMHNFQQQVPLPAISFITLRTMQGENYCRLSRGDFLALHHRSYETGLDKTDILTGMPYRSTAFNGLDLQAAPSERCLSGILSVNISRVCQEKCRCGESIRRVDIRHSPIEM